jgi:Uma2 family endonuclease
MTTLATPPASDPWKDLLKDLVPAQGHWSEELSLALTDHDKRGDYAEAHVPEYWIVNPQSDTITVLRLQGDSYVEAGTYSRGQSAGSVVMPEFAVAVNDVFDAD